MKELNDSILALVMDDTEEKLMAENTEIDKEELGLACPKCGKRIIEDGTAYRCEAGDFKCGKEILGTEISRDELQKAIAGQSDELGFRSSKTGKTFWPGWCSVRPRTALTSGFLTGMARTPG